MTGVVISATSVICAGGFGAPQVWACTRSRASRIRNSGVVNHHLDPIPMGLVPNDQLDADDSDLDSLSLPSRARRMLRLATPPLREISPALADTPPALYLGLPQLTADSSPWIERFPEYLCSRAALTLDKTASQIFPFGRASVLIALERALAILSTDSSRPILVGGVDTLLDLRLLATLDAEDRVLGPRVTDGFAPGEGAAFLLLQAATAPTTDAIVIRAAASVTDPGHRYGMEPARGEGLAAAVQLLRERLSPPVGPIASSFAGLNGENFEAKLWGVARLRHNDFFSPEMTLEHPADCLGDAGAATGALLAVLAVAALSAGHRKSPTLIWAASDFEDRGCAVLSTSV